MSSLDYLDLCRLCLVKDRVSVPIFEDEGDVRQIFLKITACLPVKVSRDDKLPKKICDDCVYKVELFYQFWNTTASAEKQLLQWLGEVGGLEDKQGYVTEVLDTNVMKQERNSDNRLDGSVLQVSGHQNSMDMGMMDNISLITMPAGNEQQFAPVPIDTSGTVQTVQAVPGPSTQNTHDAMTQSQTSVSHLVEEEEESEEDENSDDGCDNEEGLPVKEETEDDQTDRPLEPTTFVSLPCDEAGPSGLQQQKISEISEMTMSQTTDGDPKTGSSDNSLPRKANGQSPSKMTQEMNGNDNGNGTSSPRVRRKPGWLKDSITDFDSLRDICPFCDKRFKDDRRVAMHVRNVHKKPYKCDLCRRQYFSRDVLEKHRKTHNTNSHFECQVCHLKYKREETLQYHYVRVHSDVAANFGCDHCGKKYKLKQDLLLHINQVHMSSYQICRFCGKAVKNVKAHEWHHQKKLYSSGDEQVFPCSLCFKKFRSESKLENHLMRHVQRYRCQECGETFPGPGQLMNHKSKHRPGINCLICQKFFASKSNYYQHVLMHAKVRPYKCDICHEDFTQRSTLVRHRKTHPGSMNHPLKQVPIADLARKVLKSFKNFT